MRRPAQARERYQRNGVWRCVAILILLASTAACGAGHGGMSNSAEGEGWYCVDIGVRNQCQRSRTRCAALPHATSSCQWSETAVCLEFKLVSEQRIERLCSRDVDSCSQDMGNLRSDQRLVAPCQVLR